MDSITFSFEANSKQPLYLQLYNYLSTTIKMGNLKNGEKLPSKRKLAAHLNISQSTVETAYEQLAAEGYIIAKAKSGFYACAEQDFIHTPQQNQPTAQPTQVIPPAKAKYLYDLKTNIIDTSFFPFATWAKINKEVLQSQNPNLLRPSHHQGDLKLRQSIAKYLYEYRGVHASPQQIIVGAGTEYLLSLISQILEENYVFALENPGYSKTYQVLTNNHITTKLIPLDNEGMQIAQLQNSQANIAYVTPSHQFPMGIIMPINRRNQLLKWANQQENRYIIEDDYDSEFRFTGRPIPALQGLDNHNKVIYLSNFSKSIAPSIRISYLVLPPQLLKIYQNKLSFYSSTVSNFEQSVLTKFIADGHFFRHLNKMRNIYRNRKDTLVALLNKFKNADNLQIIGANAGLHLLLKINNGMTEKQLITAAEQRGVRVYGISEYYLGNTSNQATEPIIILGYANFKEAELNDCLRLLQLAWFS